MHATVHKYQGNVYLGTPKFSFKKVESAPTEFPRYVTLRTDKESTAIVHLMLSDCTWGIIFLDPDSELTLGDFSPKLVEVRLSKGSAAFRSRKKTHFTIPVKIEKVGGDEWWNYHPKAVVTGLDTEFAITAGDEIEVHCLEGKLVVDIPNATEGGTIVSANNSVAVKGETVVTIAPLTEDDFWWSTEDDGYEWDTYGDEPYLYVEDMIMEKTVEIPIIKCNAEDLANMDLDWSYNASVLKLINVTKGSLNEKALFNWNEVSPGKLKIAFASAKGVTGSGSIAVMKFEVIGNTGDTSTLTGTVTTAGKTDGTEISVSVNPGEFTVGTPAGHKLVAYYPFNGDTQDHSGNGNHGTNHGATFVSGVSGKALEFDGVNDVVEVVDNDSIDLKDAGSIEAWIKYTGPLQARWFISKASEKGYNAYLNNYAMGIINGIGFGASIGAGSGIGDSVAAFHVITNNVWIHVAFTWDGTTLRLYKNGSEITNSTQRITPTINDQSLFIGKESSSDGYFFQGVIDEVRIYNYALTASEIKANYDMLSLGGTAPPGGGIYAGFKLPPTEKWGRETWFNTQINVTSGQTISITASGMMVPSKTSNVSCGPNGTLEFEYWQKAFIPNPDWGHAALIARIGAAGDPIFIGTDTTFVAPTDGELWLGINDYDGSNNIGEFVAEICIGEKTPTPTPSGSGTSYQEATLTHSGFDFSDGTTGESPIRDGEAIFWQPGHAGTHPDYPDYSEYLWWRNTHLDNVNYTSQTKDMGAVDIATVRAVPAEWDKSPLIPPLLMGHTIVAKCYDGYVKFQVISVDPADESARVKYWYSTNTIFDEGSPTLQPTP
jgi:hypothetical protein